VVAKTSKPAAAERREHIRRLVRAHNAVSIQDLACRFAVSEMTIRRDLDHLAEEGHIRRTHGGAQVAERMFFEFDFIARRQAHRREKQAIARRAAALVQPGSRIILDTGTTTLELAQQLKNHENLTVITPSLAVASVLQFATGVQVVLLGGVLMRGQPDLTGAVTEATLDMFAVDLAFTGADGIDREGTIYTADLRVAQVDQKIRRRAEHTYVLANSPGDQRPHR